MISRYNESRVKLHVRKAKWVAWLDKKLAEFKGGIFLLLAMFKLWQNCSVKFFKFEYKIAFF